MKEYLLTKSRAMGIEMTLPQAEKLVRYHEMLIAANREMNLTRVSEDFPEAADRNYLDSLTLLSRLGNPETLVDVGTGAGFPGVPVSILRPDIRVTLMDSLGKRTAFLNDVIQALDLNAECVLSRAEDAAKLPLYRDAFDAATARAVAETNVLAEWLLPFVKPGGRVLALKGPAAEAELAAAGAAIEKLNARAVGVFDADVPGRDWSHKIVEIEKLGPTPEAFPRRAGVAEKRPLR